MLCAGILLTLSFAPYNCSVLAIIALMILMSRLLTVTARQAWLYGFCFGIGFFSTGVYWIFISMHTYGNLPGAFSYLLTSSLIIYLALFPAITCYCFVRYFFATQASLLYAFPSLWVLSEWIRSHLFTGFPWLLLGYSQINTPLKGYAPLFSVYGVSWFSVLSSTLLLLMILQYQQHHLRNVCYCAVTTLVIWASGALLSTLNWTHPSHAPLQVSLVQGNIPQTIRWVPEYFQLALNRYHDMTMSLFREKKQLIIWPEAAIPLSAQAMTTWIKSLDQTTRHYHSTVLFGIPVSTVAMNNQTNYYNAILSVGSDHRVYYKRRLVPFGEYAPLPSLLAPLFHKLNFPMSTMLAGQYHQPPFIVNSIKILPTICYEIAFPELVTTHDPSIGILLTITNDAWFGQSSAAAQHLQIAAMRALEMQRPLLFSSNTGITAIINAKGQFTDIVPPDMVTVLNSQVIAREGVTPWQYFGLSPLFSIIIGLLCMARRYYNKTKPALVMLAS